MKKKFLILSAMLTCVISMFTSCVQGDMYELYDDSTAFSLPRGKKGKDNGSQTSNNSQNGDNYRRIVYWSDSYCNQRSLTCKWGTDWYYVIYDAVYDEIDTYPPYDQEAIAGQYTFPNNVIDGVLSLPSLDVNITRRIMGKMGFSVCEGYVGNFCTIKDESHTVYIVGKGSGNESNYYVDMDGNVWGAGALNVITPL